MAKVVCRPTRTAKKPGRKTVPVKRHTRSTPKPLPKKCWRLTRLLMLAAVATLFLVRLRRLMRLRRHPECAL